MIIQINTDHNLSVHEAYRDKLKGILTDELSRFSGHITRLEVHLTDENGSKEGINDKKCVIEARVEGRHPIAVTSHANTHDQAVDSAINKLKSSLETIASKMNDHHKA
jgi:ribosomal subunit interface protein